MEGRRTEEERRGSKRTESVATGFTPPHSDTRQSVRCCEDSLHAVLQALGGIIDTESHGQRCRCWQAEGPAAATAALATATAAAAPTGWAPGSRPATETGRRMAAQRRRRLLLPQTPEAVAAACAYCLHAGACLPAACPLWLSSVAGPTAREPSWPSPGALTLLAAPASSGCVESAPAQEPCSVRR